MLTLGIPSYRLEKNIINAEIDILREMGVTFKTDVDVGKDITLAELRLDGYEAFYMAIGAQGGKKLGLENEDTEGVMTGVTFLRDTNLNKDINLDGDIIVIGGGNVAIDVARTAVRISDAEVNMFCLENSKEMPALDEEVEEALAEGITINHSWAPNRILVNDNKVVGMEFKKCISVLNEQGKFSPVFDEEQILTVAASHILIAIGQVIEWGSILKDSKVKINRNGTVELDTFTLQTDEPDIFVGGDCATGPKFAIDAIALGKEAAISIHRFVQPGQSLIIGRDRREYKAFDKTTLIIDSYDNTSRQHIEHVDANIAKKSFKDLRATFTEEQLRIETERCLGCGATVVDEYICVGCGACTKRCKFDAISLTRKYDEDTVPFEDLKGVVMKNMVKRQGRIVLHKISKVIKG